MEVLFDKLLIFHISLLQCLLLLEKEVVTLGAMCAGALLKEDLGLPFPGERERERKRERRKGRRRREIRMEKGADN